MAPDSLAIPPVISAWRRQALQPVAPPDRVEILDVLRGISLLGILLVNIALFSWPVFYDAVFANPWHSRRDIVAEWLGRFLAEGKFYPLFCFLFGVGVGIQGERAQSHGNGLARLLSRRLLVLLAIGLAHAFLIWEGDILVVYAVCGFMLLAFQERKARTLLIWAAVCLMVPLVLYSLLWGLIAVASLVPEAAKGIEQEFVKERANYEGLVYDNLRVFAHGTWNDIFVQRARNVMAVWQVTWFFAPTLFAMFLLGVYATRCRIMHDIEGNLRKIRRTLFWGLILGIPSSLLFAIASGRGTPMTVDLPSLLSTAGMTIGGPALALSYAAGIALLMRRHWWKKKLWPIGAAGRMALTNYLLQSLICTTLCYSYGLGWYGSLGRAAGMGLAAALYAAQVVFSVWWLSHYRFGPAEWLWRTLTYGKAQPLRLRRETGFA